MNTSSSKGYIAIFAVVAVAVAAFVLRQQFAAAAQPAAEEDTVRGKLVLAKNGSGMVPESPEAWFKRVGYEKLGFKSQEQADKTLALMKAKGGFNPLTKEQGDMIRELLAMDGQPHGIGVGLLVKIRDTEHRKEFLPEIKALVKPGERNQDFKRIMASWCQSGDMDLVKALAKDPNKDLAELANQAALDYEFPGKDGPGGA